MALPAAVTELQIDDRDRERVVQRLRVLTALERIDLVQFERLVDAVWASDCWPELHAVERAAPAPPPPDHVDAVHAVLSTNARGAGWRPSGLTAALALAGSLQLDLTSADWNGEPLEIEALAVLGGVEVVVPRGVAADLQGHSILGGRRLKVSDATARTATPARPRVRVTGYSVLGHISVRTHFFRRWQPVP